MGEEFKKHYVYLHIREDKNIPFYVGIGTKHKPEGSIYRKKSSKYRRAFNFSKSARRNKIWNDIFCKTKVKVQIVFESNDYEKIKEKEKEFIQLYGRIDEGNGVLANLTDGGDGFIGYISTEEVKLKRIENNYNRTHTGDDHYLSKPIFVYNSNGELVSRFGSTNQCHLEMDLDLSGIYQCLIGNIKQFKSYRFSRKDLGKINKITDFERGKWRRRKVLALDNEGNIIAEYDSVTSAANAVGTMTTNISKACKNKRSIIKGFKWRYKDDWI